METNRTVTDRHTDTLPRWQTALRAAYSAGTRAEAVHGLAPLAEVQPRVRESARLLAAYLLLSAAEELLGLSPHNTLAAGDATDDPWHH
jgi:hypothetical protein